MAIRGARSSYPWPPLMTLIFGLWLVFAAFALPQEQPFRANSWLTGVALMLVALAAYVWAPLRHAESVLATWLAVSALILGGASVAAIANNLAVACAVFVLSRVSIGDFETGPGRGLHA